MKTQPSLQSGFTLIEMLLVIALAGMLVGFASLSLVNSQQTTTVATATDSLISDLKSQQTKAMLGKVKSASNGASYGVYIEPHGYILFSGSYVPSDASNQTVQLDGITLSTTFSGNQIVFQQINGEVAGFVSGQNTITMTDTNGAHPKTITINQFGSVR